jgi:hypothetical protein
MATRFLPLFFTNVLLATCYPFARYLKGFRIFLPVPVRGAVTIICCALQNGMEDLQMFVQEARLFMHFLNFSEETYVKMIENGLI